ncbi:Degenerin mec-10 [Aphelenchoides fujianensis]|nr:Degenerin mec-10 [Aphelenchoides fujianensis]
MSAYTPLSSHINTCNEYPCAINSNQVDEHVQCNLLLAGGQTRRNLDGAGLRARIRYHLKLFGEKTSSHGIPWLESAPNLFYRIQAESLITKYNRKEKITSIHLSVDNAPFPAVTLCNINPYKDSMLKDVEAIKKILEAYKSALDRAGQLNSIAELEASSGRMGGRHKRSPSSHFEAAYSQCTCEEEDGELKCEPEVREKPEGEESTCLCAFDRASEDAWPCYPRSLWETKQCASCDAHGRCKQATDGDAKRKPCLCQSFESFCVAYDGLAEILKLWEFYGNVGSVESDIMEALGFTNMTDEIAIVTRARENIIFYMAELKEKERAALSIQKHQLIHKCSFNGHACDIDQDFLNTMDPTYGNCFVFNHNISEPKMMSRAGATYGLRVLLYVNTSEYLPTTEAVGARITIHDQDEYPFPETSGYSAPTGFVSSFGVRLTRINRLPKPFGKCVPEGKAEGNLYEGFKYSLEGCYRSCLQEQALKECNCGDPRFPVLGTARHCQVFDPVARITARLGKHEAQIEQLECHCEQPCQQPSYTVSYSCSNWPSESLNISVGKCEASPEECNEYYKENGAMIEVFFEALNFEVLSETEAYGLVKMMADLGGQLGLWSGMSAMSCIEFVFLFLEIVVMSIRQYVRNR